MKRLNPYQKQAAEWIKYAENDLKVAKDNLKLKNYPLVCYLSQQTAEKLLKAFLISKATKPPRTHLLRELVESCHKIEKSFAKFKGLAKKLEEYYIPTRYPVGEDLSIYTKTEAMKALKLTKKVTDFVKKLI